jgi:hypothetical protein
MKPVDASGKIGIFKLEVFRAGCASGGGRLSPGFQVVNEEIDVITGGADFFYFAHSYQPLLDLFQGSPYESAISVAFTDNLLFAKCLSLINY